MITLLPLLADAGKEPDPNLVTPGFAGFVTMFVLAVATFLLIRSMVHHLRKVRYGPGPQAGRGGPPETWNQPGRQIFEVREPQRPPAPSPGADPS
jgi:hypothetical protein